MTDPAPPRLPREDRPSRADRLAAKLRENLRRRKARARAIDAGAGAAAPDQDDAADAAGALPKSPASG